MHRNGAAQRRQPERSGLKGLTSAFQAAQITFRIVYSDPGKNQNVLALASMFAEDRNITAIVAGSNMISIRVIHGLHELGKTVPDDVSVVGIGSAKLDEWSTPRLARVDLRLEECGQAALDYIAAKVRGPPTPKRPFENSLGRVIRRGFREPARSGLYVREHRKRRKPRWMAGIVELSNGL